MSRFFRKFAALFVLATIATFTGCGRNQVAGKTWASMGGGTSTEIAFTTNHAFVRRYWTRGRHPAPFVGRYSIQDGVLHFETRKTEFGPSPVEEVPFSWSEDLLVLNENEPCQFKGRDFDKNTLPLQGMWKREGEIPEDGPAGRIFLPMHIEALIGGTGQWDDTPSSREEWTTCFYTNKTLGKLEEKNHDGVSGHYRRTRNYTVDGGTLTIKAEGKADEIYRRVEGEFPFEGDSFDREAWGRL